MLIKTPEPRYIAAASNKPIPNDNTKAVETDGRGFLSAVIERMILLKYANANQITENFVLVFFFSLLIFHFLYLY